MSSELTYPEKFLADLRALLKEYDVKVVIDEEFNDGEPFFSGHGIRLTLDEVKE
jgi:hypothetical protein